MNGKPLPFSIEVAVALDSDLCYGCLIEAIRSAHPHESGRAAQSVET